MIDISTFIKEFSNEPDEFPYLIQVTQLLRRNLTTFTIRLDDVQQHGDSLRCTTCFSEPKSPLICPQNIAFDLPVQAKPVRKDRGQHAPLHAHHSGGCGFADGPHARGRRCARQRRVRRHAQPENGHHSTKVGGMIVLIWSHGSLCEFVLEAFASLFW